ncbi:hypothetical protein EDD85DRAFT_932874 [Armillaria nabsnona]|nr:hypothetical protein EDD85DRAFT_932874 [Armillaria nabsnona]
MYLILNIQLFSLVPFKTSISLINTQMFLTLQLKIVAGQSFRRRDIQSNITQGPSITVLYPYHEWRVRRKQGYTRGNDTTVAVMTRGVNLSYGNSFLHLEFRARLKQDYRLPSSTFTADSSRRWCLEWKNEIQKLEGVTFMGMVDEEEYNRSSLTLETRVTKSNTAETGSRLVMGCRQMFEVEGVSSRFELDLSIAVRSSQFEFILGRLCNCERLCNYSEECTEVKNAPGAARTASGKTFAFFIPVLEIPCRRKWSPSDGLGAEIQSPTPELCYDFMFLLQRIEAF